MASIEYPITYTDILLICAFLFVIIYLLNSNLFIYYLPAKKSFKI